MLLNTFYALLLIGLGGAIGGLVLLGRRVLGVTTRKAHLEGLKMDIQIDQLKHQRAIGAFEQQNQLLAITAGEKKADEVPEAIVLSKKDVVDPKRSGRDAYDHFKMQQAAEDAVIIE